MIRGFPNGETLSGKAGKSSAEFIGGEKRTQGSEPSQYLEEEKAISDSESSGERNRNSLNPALHEGQALGARDCGLGKTLTPDPKSLIPALRARLGVVGPRK